MAEVTTRTPMSGPPLPRDRLAEAREMLAQARIDLARARSENLHVLLRDAAEKGYGAVSQAADELCRRLLATTVLSTRQRRDCLRQLESVRPALRNYGIADRFSARTRELHEVSFHAGDCDDTTVEDELQKAEEFLQVVIDELRQAPAEPVSV